MVTKYKKFLSKSLYIFFLSLSLIIFFFSTANVDGKAFDIDNIEISMPFEINFDKNVVIDKGFKLAFSELVSLITSSSDQKKINQVRLNEIRGMVESFSIKEEKFIDETYYMKLGVSFTRKKVFDYMKKKNIFPSIPAKKKVLFVPVMIDEDKKDLLLFSNNKFFDEWLDYEKNYYLLDYILPAEDLEHLDLLRAKFENIEQYDFEEITKKYDLKDSIIALIFKRNNELRILSKISIMDSIVLKNQTFSNIDISNPNQTKVIINDLKVVYEDYWKSLNQINTSIKLPLNIRVEGKDNVKIINFEKNLREIDLIYDFYVSKFDRDYIYYQVIFNGTQINFLQSMKEKGFNFNIQNKVWILQ